MPWPEPGALHLQPESIPLEEVFEGGFATASARRICAFAEIVHGEEAEPLISGSSQHHAVGVDDSISQLRLYSRSNKREYLNAVMEKVKDTKIARFVDKLAVSSEPGLTNAQLMLTNHDLKPGMIESRHIRHLLY